MRVEFGLELTDVALPRFAVEAVEGIGKIFTLATLVLNVLEGKPKVEIVFHGLNPEDPDRKIAGFIEILESAGDEGNHGFERGPRGQVTGSSSYFQWLTVTRD